MSTIDTFRQQLGVWARAHAQPGAKVANVASLGGHSAVTIGFDLTVAGQITDRLVLKVPPLGARAKNNFDFLRQVPLFKVLAKHHTLAPTARWWSEDERWFGRPYLVMSRLPGTSLPDIFDTTAGAAPIGAGDLFYQAMDALIQIHAIDGLKELEGWSSPRLLTREIDHWVGVLSKSTNPEWVAKGIRLQKLLHKSTPQACALGVVHGDFYSNNWMFDEGRLTGVVDWESTTLGPILLDLGWICMMYDTASWGPLRRARMGWHPQPESLLATYAQGSTVDLSAINWYRALAGYRLACNTAYYFELHQSGKRPNPAWDVLGESFPFMVDRAFELLRE